MSSFHLPTLSYSPSTSGVPVPGNDTPESNQQKQQGAKRSSTADPVPSGAKASRKVPKIPSQQVEQSLAARRAKIVYTAMERLLEETVTDPQHLQSLVRPLSGEEYLQVAEERHLAGMCGSAACPHERPLASGRGRLQLETHTGFCSSACELAARRLASRLGSADAAMDRFAAGSEQPVKAKAQDKPTNTFAAGAADNPIMLAQVKEKDADVLQAEAQMRAAMANEASAALAAGLDSNAVEGYVPRNSPSIAAAAAHLPTQPARADTTTASKSSGSRTTQPGPVQTQSLAGPAERHDVSASTMPQTAHDNSEQSTMATSTSGIKTYSSQSHLNGAQHGSATSGSASEASRTGGAEAPPQDRRKSASNVSDAGGYGAGGGLQQPAEGRRRKALASHAAEGRVMENDAGEGGASQSADPAQQPVLVFEVEDPEGPLDAPSEDIGQQFGRLQLKTAAELGLPAEQLSELTAAQGDTPQPTLNQDLELWKRHVGIQQGNGHEADEAPGVAAEVRERALPGLIPAPELLEEDIASEAELDSDEETALQWLSEPLPDFGRHLSGFGQLFTLLEGMVTERSSQLLRGHGHGHAQSTEVPQHSSLQGQAVLEGGIERVLGDVMKAMHVPALRSAVEQHLHSLAGTFHFAAAIPNLQGTDWEMLTVVMLKALSLEKLPALQDMFDSRAGAKNLDTYVSSIGFSMEELWSLLDLLLE